MITNYDNDNKPRNIPNCCQTAIRLSLSFQSGKVTKTKRPNITNDNIPLSFLISPKVTSSLAVSCIPGPFYGHLVWETPHPMVYWQATQAEIASWDLEQIWPITLSWVVRCCRWLNAKSPIESCQAYIYIARFQDVLQNLSTDQEVVCVNHSKSKSSKDFV